MVLRDLIGDVFRTLWAHKLRTFLTMFGIAWGIVSIVLMVAAGEGLRKGQEDQAKNLGKDLMIVFHGRTSLQAGGLRAGRQVHGDDQDVPVVRPSRRIASMRFRSWSKMMYAPTATTTTPPSP
jgi:putative ABC transport system permease protein